MTGIREQSAEKMKLELALSNVCFQNVSFAAFLSTASRIGIRKILYWAGVPHLYIDSGCRESAEEHREQMRHYEMIPWMFIPRPYYYRISASQWAAGRGRCMDYYSQCLDSAAELGSERIYLWLNTQKLERGNENVFDEAVAFAAEFIRRAEEKKMIPVLGTNTMGTPALIKNRAGFEAFLEQIGTENYEIALDLAGIIRSGETLEEWMESYGDRVSMIFFNDCNRNQVKCWPYGTCNIKKYLGVLRQCQYQGILGEFLLNEEYFANPEVWAEENASYILECLKK